MSRGPTKQMIGRVIWMAGLILVIFVLCIGILGKIQFVDGEDLQQKAVAQQLLDTSIQPKRGTIYDSNLKVLAKSYSVWDVILSPADIKSDEERHQVAKKLAEVLEMDEQTIYDKTGNTNSHYEVVKRKIERPVYEEILKFANDNNIKCINMVENSKRDYPYGNFAATVLGFTGTDNNGLSGLEAKYERYLKGVPGRIVTAKNAQGTDIDIRYEKQYDAKDGDNLVLTIDEVIQHYVEKHLEIAAKENKVTNRATVIVEDVKTGGILAMATKGDYNPNEPFVIDDPNMLDALSALEGEEAAKEKIKIQQEQWRNKSINDTYEPGSVFKAITAAIALEEKVVKQDDRFTCTGSYVAYPGTKPIKCWKHGGHGNITFREGLQVSCNPTFMQVGARIGAERFMEYFGAFGFTEKTGIDLPGESVGVYHKLEDMGPIELATSSFGQTFRVSPIQMINAISCIANDGKLMEPYVVKQILDSDNNVVQTTEPKVRRQVISESVSKELSEMLGSVTTDGGGTNAYIPGYRVASKTGTSEKRDAEDQSLRIASTACFAPYDDPQIAIICILDEPHADNIYGGTIAAPVCRDILAEILPYLGIEPRYTEEELAKMETTTPKLEGREASGVSSYIENAGLKCKIIGNGEKVIKQIPEANSPIPLGGTVILYTEEGNTTTASVPNFVGMSITQANSTATNAGLNVKIKGAINEANAKAIKQSIDSGTSVDKGTVITIDFTNAVEGD